VKVAPTEEEKPREERTEVPGEEPFEADTTEGREE
jgi:hypothetical protein